MMSKTFIKISNEQVYAKLCNIEEKVDNINGTIRWHSKAIGAIIVIIVTLIGALVAA